MSNATNSILLSLSVFRVPQRKSCLDAARSCSSLTAIFMQVCAVNAKFHIPFGNATVVKWCNSPVSYTTRASACSSHAGLSLHVVFRGSFSLWPLHLLSSVALDMLLFVWSSIRVLLMRKSIERSSVKDIKGLAMCESSRFC